MKAHIWLGQFGDDAPRDFFEERYSDSDEGDSPLSLFGESQGEYWYDHDFIEMSFLRDMSDIESLATGHSYFDQYLSALLASAERLGITRANVFVWADASLFSKPRTVSGPGYSLWYVGQFPYEA